MADAEDDHDHPTLTYLGASAADDVVDALGKTHVSLAENLALARRFGELEDSEKARLVETQRAVETHAGWTPGLHAEGDICAACGTPTTILFSDRFDEGALPFAAFVDDVPVHATAACLEEFARRHPKRAPQLVDRLRREFTRDRERPTAGMSMFFRHDVLAHPPFALEDWANSVAEANPEGVDRRRKRDMERLLQWVHRRLYH